jgi:hypothetical protein
MKENKEKALQASTDKLKEMIMAEIEQSWKEGYKNGTIITCATLYRTLKIAGLEETNVLYDILKDMAKKQGCEDLPSYIKNMKETTKNV